MFNKGIFAKHSPLNKSALLKNNFLISNETVSFGCSKEPFHSYVVCTQRKHLNETVLLSTQGTKNSTCQLIITREI